VGKLGRIFELALALVHHSQPTDAISSCEEEASEGLFTTFL
jgi:hypothetical protein